MAAKVDFTVRRLAAPLPHHKKFEVFAPKGYRFVSGAHSIVCYDAAEVAEAKTEAVEPCPEDCDCQ